MAGPWSRHRDRRIRPSVELDAAHLSNIEVAGAFNNAVIDFRTAAKKSAPNTARKAGKTAARKRTKK